MDTKACVYCGCDVQCEEAVASYVEFPDDETYISAFPYDAANTFSEFVRLTWFINTLIPMRGTYADVYALCSECCTTTIELIDALGIDAQFLRDNGEI